MPPKELKRGDACPNCGGDLEPARTLSADDYKRTYDRENPRPVPYGADTASPEQRGELGALFVCQTCGYKTRFKAESSDRGSDRTDTGVTGTDAARGSSSPGRASVVDRLADAVIEDRAPAYRAAANPHDEIERLQRQIADLKAQQGGESKPAA